MAYENILTEIPADGVGLIRLNRPKATQRPQRPAHE